MPWGHNQVLGAFLAGKGRASSAKHVRCEPQEGGGSARLLLQHLHPSYPELLLGGGSSILSTRCPHGPHSLGGWPWANVAKQPARWWLAQGQTVSKDLPAQAVQWVSSQGAHFQEGMHPSPWERGPLSCAHTSKWLRSSCILPMAPTGESIKPDIQPWPPSPATSPWSPAGRDPQLLPILCPLPALASVQSVTDATISTSPGRNHITGFIYAQYPSPATPLATTRAL